jgi:hypothetical protein
MWIGPQSGWLNLDAARFSTCVVASLEDDDIESALDKFVGRCEPRHTSAEDDDPRHE